MRLFIVLLRMAIGWHFLYEGLEKVYPPDEGKPFTSAGYLRNATGPLGPRFRAIVPDVYSLKTFRRDKQGLPSGIKREWKQDLETFARHYDLTEQQKDEAQEALETAEDQADAWFRDVENAQKVKKYEDDLARVLKIENDPEALDYQRELAYKQRQELETTRKELVAPMDAWTEALHDSWEELLTAEQKERTPVSEPWTDLDWVNVTTKYGLVIAGACLMLGFLTPVAALWGAAFLTLIYLTMPPWPGLPSNPMAEGHYMIVNKNLIELLACLVLASTPNGLWIGLDALVFGWIGRGRRVEDDPGYRPTKSEHASLVLPAAVPKHGETSDDDPDPRGT